MRVHGLHAHILALCLGTSLRWRLTLIWCCSFSSLQCFSHSLFASTSWNSNKVRACVCVTSWRYLCLMQASGGYKLALIHREGPNLGRRVKHPPFLIAVRVFFCFVISACSMYIARVDGRACAGVLRTVRGCAQSSAWRLRVHTGSTNRILLCNDAKEEYIRFLARVRMFHAWAKEILENS